MPPVQITRLALDTVQGSLDWLQIGGAMGIALGDDQNGLISAQFAVAFNGDYETICATDGAGNTAPLNLAGLDLALEVAEGNNTVNLAYAGDPVIVLHPTQWADIRDDLRTSGNFIAKPEVTGINPALDASGIAGTYYGAPILLSSTVTGGGHVAAAGAGVELTTGAAFAAGNTRRGAIMTMQQAIGFTMSMDPNIRTEDTVLIGTGGVNVVAGYVGAAARFSPFMCGIQSILSNAEDGQAWPLRWTWRMMSWTAIWRAAGFWCLKGHQGPSLRRRRRPRRKPRRRLTANDPDRLRRYGRHASHGAELWAPQRREP